MATDKRKRAIRSRMATTGEPYSQAAHVIDQDHGAGPADAVAVIEVLDEMPPLGADPVESAAERYARRWAPMPRLFAAARADTTMTAADWALLHDHRADLTRQ